jgi:glycosyltransferase involved in cell wall biosynthesis
MRPAPRFLVFLPVRDGERYVARAVASVLAQTDPDFRLYVLDNASRDGTLAAVRAFQDPRIVIRESPEALSIERSWARMAEVARREADPGQTMTILSHDDLLYPGFLSEVGRLAAAHPDASLLQTHFHLVDAEGRTIRPCAPIPAVETGAEYFRCRAWGFRDSFGTGHAFSVRDYLAVGGVPDFPRLLFADDALVYRLSSLRYKAASPAIAFAYRFHPASASGTTSFSRNADLVRALDRWRTEILERHPDLIADEIGEIALGMMMRRTLRATDLGVAERRYGTEVRETKRRLADAAAGHLRGVRYLEPGGKGSLPRALRLHLKGARRLVKDWVTR